MNDGRIELIDGVVTLRAGERTLDRAPADDVVRLYWTAAADALFHGDETYYVALLADRLWVIPYFAQKVMTFLKEVAPRLARNGELFRAEVSGCPAAWRKKAFGIVPLFPTPGLGVHALSTLPQFVSVQPISADAVLEKGSDARG